MFERSENADIFATGYPDEGSFPTHIDSLKKRVYNVLVDRMQRHSVSTANLTIELLELMLPKGNPELLGAPHVPPNFCDGCGDAFHLES